MGKPSVVAMLLGALMWQQYGGGGRPSAGPLPSDRAEKSGRRSRSQVVPGLSHGAGEDQEEEGGMLDLGFTLSWCR